MSNVPKLRFTEFDSDWQFYKLKELLDLVIDNRGKTPPVEKSGIPLIEVNSIGEKKIRWGKVAKFVSPTTYDTWFRKHIEKGDVLFSTVGQTAICSHYDGESKGAIAQNIVGLRFTDHVAQFMYQLLIGEKNNRKFKKIEMVAVQPSIKVSQMIMLKFALPSIAEQQKIADFLTAVDNKIEQLTRKEELLKQYKKGVMQKIFSQEIRFKADDGSEFPEWEMFKLGEVATFSKGKGISKADISEDGELPCIRYGELYTHYNETISQVRSHTNISSDDLHISRGGEVIIPASGETRLDIATAACVIPNGVALGGDLNVITSSQDGVFISYYLNNAKRHDIANLAQGVSVMHLYSSQLKNLQINIPTLAEQRKINAFLTALDEQVALCRNQSTLAKTFKKGLLQQMFV